MKDYLHWLNGQAYYRRRVPSDLIEFVGKKEIKKALGTSDKKIARVHYAAEHSRVEQHWHELRERAKRAANDPDQLSSFTNDEMSGLALKWLDRTEKRLFEARVKQLEVLTDDDVERLFIEAQIELQDITEANSKQDTGPGLTEGSEFLQREGITFRRGTDAYRRFGFYMNEAILRFHKNVVNSMKGANSSLLNAANGASANQSGIVPVTLETLVEKYLADPTRGDNVKTAGGYKSMASLLLRILDRKVLAHELSREQCEGVLRTLKAYPSNATKKYGQKSLEEVIALAKRDKCPLLSVRTINKHMQMLSSVLAYGIPHKHLLVNVAADLTLRDQTADSERRDILTVEELQWLFNAPIYTGCVDDVYGFSKPGPARPRRHRFWVPLIALHSAMRLNEICQLHAEDIQQQDGVWVFVLKKSSTTGSKALKNNSSVRNVPVHPELLKIGLIEFRNKLIKSGGGMLFPELASSDPKIYPSDIASKSILRVLRSVGIKADGAKRDNHSMRKTFNQLLQKQGVAESIRNQIGGWAEDRAVRARHYDAKLTIPELYDAIKDINYPDLDLSHLYIENQKI